MLQELFSLFLLGMISGAGICSLSCLHYLGPYLMGTGRGFRDGVLASWIFLCGKIVSYSILCGFAAIFGKLFLSETFRPGGVLPGIILIAIAFTIPFSRRPGCGTNRCTTTRKVSLFGLGVSSSLLPCPTMAAVFLLAANKGAIIAGMGYGAMFGVGLALSPLMIIGGGLSMIANRLRLEPGNLISAVRALSIIIMIGMGIRLMLMEI
ncbi:MAG: sulfite exporter TauE/SafE family protein [Desulfobacteraceae bacterium]|jgi:thiol:disulfide interchange protein DsbD